MTSTTTAGVAMTMALGLVACGKDHDTKPMPSETATVPAAAGRPGSATLATRWPAAYCSIVPAEEITAWLGMTVTSRVQMWTCDYLTSSENGAHITYYSDDSEYRIAKARREHRGKPGEAIAGLGREAEYGSTGNGAGLDVVLADGRAFQVSARKLKVSDRDAAVEVARLVLAKL